MSELVFVPAFKKPDQAVQKLIDDGKLVKAAVTTGGIDPNAKGPKAGTYYRSA